MTASTTSPQDTALALQDRWEIVDALYRFARGRGFNDRDTLTAAFPPDVVADLSPAAAKLGIAFPVLTGRDAVVQALLGSSGLLETTHAVTDPRIDITGDQARLHAIVEAQHPPPADHSRHCLMKNQYDVDLVRDGQR